MSVTAAEGFVAAGCHAGIKKRRFDMALLATEDRQPVACAAVFTQNKFAAPPVELDRKLHAANGGRATAVIVLLAGFGPLGCDTSASKPSGPPGQTSHKANPRMARRKFSANISECLTPPRNV